MLTPKLEELILCGRAFFKTAVIGGSKTTIDIDTDRFIIITDITYLPYYNELRPINQREDANTQLSIYGERGFNHYFFANARIYGAVDQGSEVSAKAAMPPQKIDTYLLHTTQVGFSFLVDRDTIPSSTIGIAAANNPGFEPPLDYGKDGLTGSLNVDTQVIVTGALVNQVVNRLTGLGIGSDATQQIQMEARGLLKPEVNNNKFFPIANINYVEILGQPNNIGI